MNRFASIVLCIAIAGISTAVAKSPAEIANNNARAIVFVKKINEHGEVMSGTGLIISHDGYVLTASHLAPSQPDEKLVATVGQREGPAYPLEFRDKDSQRDLALFQLPQSSSCRSSLILSNDPLDDSQHLVAVGFPADRGLSRATVAITNTHTPLGFYASDGQLEEGYSGAPVFNEDGKVIGIVQGGTVSGARSNDIVPIASAIAMAKKLGVRAAVGEAVPYDDSCYASCRAPAHGIEKWGHEEAWSANTGKVNGGYNQTLACNGLIAGKLATQPPGSRIDLDLGKAGMWESSDKDFFGHVTYVYYCKGTLRSSPVYKERRSPACQLWE
ncbi:S1 family peptidase [Nitrobacter sp.]|uniref:S1 family peptidase n=1 Tax=Nitrobacter sp. TaxID=29420 RepID=UPI003F64B70A